MTGLKKNPPPLRALTVQPPWSWSIVHAGKDIENRTTAWKYRGPLFIHQGARWSERGSEHREYLRALAAAPSRVRHVLDVKGAIIGRAELTGVHPAAPDLSCCYRGDDSGGGPSPWAEASYDEHLPDGHFRRRRDVVHLELADVRRLYNPVPCAGRLGLWTPDRDAAEEALRQEYSALRDDEVPQRDPAYDRVNQLRAIVRDVGWSWPT